MMLLLPCYSCIVYSTCIPVTHDPCTASSSAAAYALKGWWWCCCCRCRWRLYMPFSGGNCLRSPLLLLSTPRRRHVPSSQPCQLLVGSSFFSRCRGPLSPTLLLLLGLPQCTCRPRNNDLPIALVEVVPASRGRSTGRCTCSCVSHLPSAPAASVHAHVCE